MNNNNFSFGNCWVTYILWHIMWFSFTSSLFLSPPYFMLSEHPSKSMSVISTIPFIQQIFLSIVYKVYHPIFFFHHLYELMLRMLFSSDSCKSQLANVENILLWTKLALFILWSMDYRITMKYNIFCGLNEWIYHNANLILDSQYSSFISDYSIQISLGEWFACSNIEIDLKMLRKPSFYSLNTWVLSMPSRPLFSLKNNHSTSDVRDGSPPLTWKNPPHNVWWYTRSLLTWMKKNFFFALLDSSFSSVSGKSSIQ